MVKLLESGAINRKPLLILETDGASDVAPCFPMTLSWAIAHFKKFNLDVYIHGVNASGSSAFNPCERRMVPLSHDLSGVILPYDTYGSHLDGNGNTIDVELEKRNFCAAGEVLKEI